MNGWWCYHLRRAQHLLVITMAEQVQKDDEAPKTGSTPAGPRSRSTSGVSYPYFDLDTSVKVAQEIHSRGGGQCSPDQLAAWLDYKSVKSGTYNTRIAAARNFGLIQSVGGKFSVTDRGLKIVAPVMPEDALSAKVEAFLAVELFSKVFEQFRGKQLPPESGLKNLFRAEPYLILPDRIDPAVRVFLNSADQAGFFSTTNDRTRLIEPHAGRQAPPPASISAEEQKQKEEVQLPVAEKPKAAANAGADGTGGVHSAIIGLLRELPPPGSSWAAPKKKRFLDAFKATVDFIYPEDDE